MSLASLTRMAGSASSSFDGEYRAPESLIGTGDPEEGESSFEVIERRAGRGPASPPAPGQRPPGQPPESRRPDRRPVVSALGVVSDYIPSEILAMYIAVIGLIQTTRASYPLKWSIFGGAVVVLLVYVGLTYLQQRADARQSGPTTAPPSLRHFIYVAAMATVAFTAYAMSIPGSPFQQITRDLTILGGAVALALAALMPMIGSILGVTPED
jgi:hypothetical protein